MAKSRGDAMRSETKTVGYGFVGHWVDGRLGWNMPDHLEGYNGYTEAPTMRNLYGRHKPHVLCRITVEQVLDSRGRPIVRYPGGKKPEQVRGDDA